MRPSMAARQIGAKKLWVSRLLQTAGCGQEKGNIEPTVPK